MSILSEPHFHCEDAARERLENIIWPNGVHCPRCGGFDRITTVSGGRSGLYRCGPCKRQFTVTVGTIFESSHVPLHKWFQAAHLMASSKKGISAHQLHRTLKITYKTAWFMEHRLREAMRSGNLSPMGGAGSVVEADETYHGKKAEQPTHRRDGLPYKGSRDGRPVFGPAGKRAIVALVERGGSVRTFHVDRADKRTVSGIVSDNLNRETVLHTDESPLYPEIGLHFAGHETVRHSSDEYVRGAVHTNTVEGYFSIFKRGMKGVYQHCAEKHLHRYLAEFDFRYNNRSALGIEDASRTTNALRGSVGKRLTYRDSSAA
jgi:transposase-like protein